jgi:hypothetical protein
VTDPALTGLLTAVAEGDLDAVLVLGDWLEERGDPRGERVRRLYVLLYDYWMYAPLSFRVQGVARQAVWPLFPEHGGADGLESRL